MIWTGASFQQLLSRGRRPVLFHLRLFRLAVAVPLALRPNRRQLRCGRAHQLHEQMLPSVAATTPHLDRRQELPQRPPLLWRLAPAILHVVIPEIYYRTHLRRAQLPRAMTCPFPHQAAEAAARSPCTSCPPLKQSKWEEARATHRLQRSLSRRLGRQARRVAPRPARRTAARTQRECRHFLATVPRHIIIREQRNQDHLHLQQPLL